MKTMPMKIMPITFALLPLSGCGADVAADPVQTARAQTRLDQLLAGKEPGRRLTCLPRQDAERQTNIDERTIVFQPSAGHSRAYRSDLSPPCPGLDRNSTIIRRSTSTSICAGEIFEVRDSGTQIPRGSCTFGEFTEYRRPKR